jgi:tetratricopeptide (TPR) repeat protein
MRFRSLYLVLALGLMAVLAPCVARAAAATATPDAVTQAREYIASGDMATAMTFLNTYVQAHPRDLEARRFLGDLYFRVGKVDEAAVIYQDVLRDYPYDKETHNRLGSVFAEENRIDDAIKQFEAALPGTDSVNDLVELHTRRGDLGAYEGQVEMAAHAFPGDADTQAELGQLYYALHQPERAEVVYQRALDDDPDDLTALNGLGLAYLDMKNYGLSVEAFLRCLHVDPTLFQCQNNMGATYLEWHKWTDAKSTLDRAFRLAPERGETFVNYGYLDDATGDWQKATAEYGKAIEHYPYLREAYIDLALDYEHHDLNVLAQAVLIKGIASVYDDGRLHVLLGEAYEAQGNRIDALTQFRLGQKGSDPDAISIANQQVDALTVNTTSPPQNPQ